jgi:Tol biopolymer transport system component
MVKLGENAQVAWSPDGRYVAVADKQDTPVEARLRLFALPLPSAGTGEERVVEIADQGIIDRLRWSPDGSRLAFTLSRFGRDAGPSLSAVDPATARARELVRGSVGEIAWTPDSRFITAMMLDVSAGAIVTLNAMNGDVEETVLSGPDASCQRDLAWSPDGKTLAYAGPGLREACGDAGNWGVWTWDRATQMTTHLFTGAADAPHWLQNGSLAAIVSIPRPDTVRALTLLAYESPGSEPRTVADNIPRMFPQPPRMLQTVGNTLMYAISTCDEAGAFTWSPGQSAPRRLTPADVYAYQPALAPDGRQVAYVKVGDNLRELVIAPLGDGAPRTVLATTELGLQVGTQGPSGAGGHWSPDGKWLAVEVMSEQLRDCVI